MRNRIFTVFACWLAVSAIPCAEAQTERQEANALTPALVNPDAPRILNDLVCVKACQDGHLSCDPASVEKAGGRCS